MVGEGSLLPTVGAISLQFLTDNYVLVPVIESRRSGHRAALYIYDLSHEIPGRLAYHEVPRVATFGLPMLVDGAFYPSIYAVSEAPIRTPSGSATAHLHGFAQDPALRLIAFQLRIVSISITPLPSDGSEEPQMNVEHNITRSSVNLFVHAGTLSPTRWCHGTTTGTSADIPWEAWAPEARLILTPGFKKVGLAEQVSHTRCLIPEKVSEPAPPAEDCADEETADAGVDDDAELGALGVWIYDFAPAPALRHASRAAANAGPWTYVMEPEELDVPVFRSKVVSALPYRKLNTGLRVWETHSELAEACLLSCTPET